MSLDPLAAAPDDLTSAPPPSSAGGGAPARVGWRFMLLFFLAFVGFWVPVLAPVLVTLSLRVTQLVGPDRAGAALGGVVAVGALVALVAAPLFGRLSDGTTSRFGMRRPWLVVGFLGGAVGVVVMAFAPNVLVLGVGFAVSQLFFNATGAGLLGVLADQFPPEQRGTASGLVGAAIPIALPVAAGLASLVSPDPHLMFLLPLVVGAVPVALFTALLRDRRLAPGDQAPFELRRFAATFWVNPVRHRDFGLVWWGRCALILASSTLTTYQAFYLMRVLGASTDEVATMIFQATAVSAATTLVSALVGGRLSDVLGRRKVFVYVSCALIAVGLLVVVTSPTFPGFLLGVAITGLGTGAFVSVDTALFVDVLPDPRTVAKDLGVANIANTLPQVAAPAISPLILAASGGSYTVLFTVAIGYAVVAALFIIPVRGAR